MSHLHGHPHPRRGFLKRSFTFFGLFAGASAGSRSAPAQTPRPTPPVPKTTAPVPKKEDKSQPGYTVFDAHLHCPSEDGHVWQWQPVTPMFDDFVRHLDRTGVHRGIINSVRCQEAKTVAEFVAGNREVARFVEKYNGRFVGACVVNPLFIDEALKEIETCRRELGFVWVGELCNYTVPYEYTIKEFELLVEQVVKLGMVLDVHTGLREMEYIIKKFPQATIVFPHMGDHGDIFQRIDLVARNPNCFLDTSGAGQDRMGMLEYAIQTIGPDRVLFGSDFSINDPATGIARVRHAFLTEEQKRKVFLGNVEELLKRASARA
jgi:predicted TIM-barrel fold metal-dependent hydrolase